MSLKGKTLFITGASRGIGLAIGLRAARDGANIVIAAKTAEPHKKLPGTIYSAAEEVEKAGGQALPLVVDVREPDSVNAAVAAAVENFGGIDICVNNASAIQLSGTLATDIRRYDLMHQVNARGTFLVSRACLPHLLKAQNPHVLMLSPPLDMSPRWFGNHVAYTMAKYGMSMCVLGMAEEFRGQGVAFNALWPRTGIATAAIEFALAGEEGMKHCRTPDIIADAAHAIFNKPSRSCTGNFFIDDVLLYEEGERDFDKYRVDPTKDLMPDFFVPENCALPPGVSMKAVGRRAGA
jgi:citronellol/citronellal dehydrogenase